MTITQASQGAYQAVSARSHTEREAFWSEAASQVSWLREPTKSFDQIGPHEWRWFADGMLNVSANALDRHIDEGRGENAAVIYDSAMTNTKVTLTYNDLRDEVAQFAGALRNHGVAKGDRVLLYLPMTPEAVIAMLACARIGAIHSVVFGGFAANELAIRIMDASPKIIVTSSGGCEPGRTVQYLPLVSRALEIAEGNSVTTVIVSDREAVPGNAAEMQGKNGVQWLDWAEVSASAQPAAPVPLPSDHPLYILYTSGTTGNPKGVVRDSGGYTVALNWAMRNIYNVGHGETMFTASDVGWVVGHSFIVYGPLLAGATTVLFEGKPVGTPDAGTFWRIVEDYDVKSMFTAPTALRAIKREDPDLLHLANHDVSRLRALYVAGERLDPETWHWAHDHIGVPVVDHWWQTETGWPICANPLGIEELPQKAGSTAVPMPGYDIHIVDSKGIQITQPGREGNIAIKLPLPPGTLLKIWGNEQRFYEGYLAAFDGYYATGDAGYFDEDGYLFVMGRTDDVINVAGHRLSTGALEEALSLHPDVAECAIIGVHDELKGQRAAGFVTLKRGSLLDRETISSQLVSLVRETVGPVASFRDVTVVEGLPKTRSGKILRKTMRQIVDGEHYTVPATIEDPTTIDALVEALNHTYSAPATQVISLDPSQPRTPEKRMANWLRERFSGKA